MVTSEFLLSSSRVRQALINAKRFQEQLYVCLGLFNYTGRIPFKFKLATRIAIILTNQTQGLLAMGRNNSKKYINKMVD